MHRILPLLLTVLFASPLAAASDASAPDAHRMKGYEIYGWRDPDASWRFALLGGTNRLKSADEIHHGAIDEQELEARLDRLPELESVSWCPPAGLALQPALELPPSAVLDRIVKLAVRRNLHLSICGREHEPE